MFEKEGEESGAQITAWAGALKAQLAVALADLENDKPDHAEKRARALSAVLKAMRETGEFEVFARAHAPAEDIDALRAELRRRFERIVGVSLEELSANAGT